MTRSRDLLGTPLPALPLPPLPAARSPAETAPATARFGAPPGARPSGQGGEVTRETAAEDAGVLEPTGAGPWGTPGRGWVLKDPRRQPRVSGNNLGAGRLSPQQAFLPAGSCRTPTALAPTPQNLPPAPRPPQPLTAADVQRGLAQGVGLLTLSGGIQESPPSLPGVSRDGQPSYTCPGSSLPSRGRRGLNQRAGAGSEAGFMNGGSSLRAGLATPGGRREHCGLGVSRRA